MITYEKSSAASSGTAALLAEPMQGPRGALTHGRHFGLASQVALPYAQSATMPPGGRDDKVRCLVGRKKSKGPVCRALTIKAHIRLSREHAYRRQQKGGATRSSPGDCSAFKTNLPPTWRAAEGMTTNHTVMAAAGAMTTIMNSSDTSFVKKCQGKSSVFASSSRLWFPNVCRFRTGWCRRAPGCRRTPTWRWKAIGLSYQCWHTLWKVCWGLFSNVC